ncbi:hypothetical protein CP533_5215 [Ophiocordyceps camponoti-saundersi (nom. inval.)]|nr:hypothetical protein CP533_5215 [Ophiocordyceps camponoti-saundersi (nom. inval.)]
MAYRLSLFSLLLLLLLQTALPVLSLTSQEASALRQEVIGNLAAWANKTPQNQKHPAPKSNANGTQVTQWTECMDLDCSPKRTPIAYNQFRRITKDISPTNPVSKIPRSKQFKRFRLTIGLSIILFRAETLGPGLARTKGTAGLKRLLFKGLSAATFPLVVDVLFNLPFYAFRMYHHDFENSNEFENADASLSIVPGLRCLTRLSKVYSLDEEYGDELLIDTPLCLLADATFYVPYWPLAVSLFFIRNEISSVFASIRKSVALRERYKSFETLQKERAQGWNRILDNVTDRLTSQDYKNEVADLFKTEIVAIGYAASEGVQNLFHDLFKFEEEGVKADALVEGFKKGVDFLHLRACQEIKQRAHVLSLTMVNQLRDELTSSGEAYSIQFLDKFRSLALGDQQDKEFEWIPSDSKLGASLIRAGLKEPPKQDFTVAEVDDTIENLRKTPLHPKGDFMWNFEPILKAKTGKTIVDIVNEVTSSLYPPKMRDCANYMNELFQETLGDTISAEVELTDDYVDCDDEATNTDPHIVTKVAKGHLRCGNNTSSWAWSEDHNQLLECRGLNGEEVCKGFPHVNLETTIYRRAERSGVLDMREPDVSDADNPTGLKMIDCRGEGLSRDPQEQERLKRGHIGCLTDGGVWFWSHGILRYCIRGTLDCDSFTPGNMSSIARLRATEAGVIRNKPEIWSYMETVDCSLRGAFKNKTLLEGVHNGTIACGEEKHKMNKWFWIGDRLNHCAGDTCQRFTSGRVPEDAAILARKVGIMPKPPKAITECQNNFFSKKGLQEDVAKGELGCGFENNYWVWDNGGLRFCAFNGEKPCSEHEIHEALESESLWTWWKMPAKIQDCKALPKSNLWEYDEPMWQGKLACGNETLFYMWKDDEIQKCAWNPDGYRQCALFKSSEKSVLSKAMETGLIGYRPETPPPRPRLFRYASESYNILDCKNVFISDKEERQMLDGKLACGSKEDFWMWNGKNPAKCRKENWSAGDRPVCVNFDPDDERVRGQLAEIGLVSERPEQQPPFKYRNCSALTSQERPRYYEKMWAEKIACGDRKVFFKWTGSRSISFCGYNDKKKLLCRTSPLFPADKQDDSVKRFFAFAAGSGLVPFPKPSDWEKIKPADVKEPEDEGPETAETDTGPYDPQKTDHFKIEDCPKLPRDKKDENDTKIRQGFIACGNKHDYWKWSGFKILEHCRKVRHRKELVCDKFNLRGGHSKQVQEATRKAVAAGLVITPATKPKEEPVDDGNPGIEESLEQQARAAGYR